MTPKNGIIETGAPGAPGAKDAAAQASRDSEGFVKRFLAGVPADVATTFSQAQLQAIKNFMIDDRKRLAVDIRWTISLIWFRFFIVILAGRERRSDQRLAAERAARPFLTWSNVTAIAVFLVMLLISMLGMNYALMMAPVPGID